MRKAEGYFPRESSILRRVHEERWVGLLYGQRALMLGALMSPLAFYGTSAHTSSKLRPFQRLSHTGKVFETVFFGDRDEADQALAFVHRLHERVEGTVAEDLGPWPAGTAYSALDPESMLWGVVAPAFDSALACHEGLVRRLDGDEREALWRDYLTFGELFGMPRDAAPSTYTAFRAAWKERLHSDEAFLTDEACRAGFETGFAIPVPRVNQPGMEVLEFILCGTLPKRARELYGLRWGRPQRIAFEALTAAIRRGTVLVPGPLRRGSCAYFFDIVESSERSRIAAGEAPSMFPTGESARAAF
jgi:uncharacterized protein (DUF2236 family)